MATSSAMVELVGCVLAQCVSELVRRDGENWYIIVNIVRA